MRIEFMLDQQECVLEAEVGMLLSEVLKSHGWQDQTVTVDGRAVDCRLMLAAQVHGRKIQLLADPVESRPLLELLLAPQHSPAGR